MKVRFMKLDLEDGAFRTRFGIIPRFHSLSVSRLQYNRGEWTRCCAYVLLST